MPNPYAMLVEEFSERAKGQLQGYAEKLIVALKEDKAKVADEIWGEKMDLQSSDVYISIPLGFDDASVRISLNVSYARPNEDDRDVKIDSAEILAFEVIEPVELTADRQEEVAVELKHETIQELAELLKRYVPTDIETVAAFGIQPITADDRASWEAEHRGDTARDEG